MSKFRFSAADVKAAVRDIRSTLIGNKVVNIYDLGDKTYLFKIAVPGSEKLFLLLESGVRIHTTKFTRDIPDLPAPFTMKLRKFLRSKRLEDICQVGDDRVIDMKFGSGADAYHVILELYSSGNIILTDKDYTVLSLWRSHQFAEDVTLKVGEVYPMAFTSSTLKNTFLLEAIRADFAVQNITDKTTSVQPEDISSCSNADLLRKWAKRKSVENETRSEIMEERAEMSRLEGAGGKHMKKAAKRAARKLTLKTLLLNPSSGISWVGPDIIDHCVLAAAKKVQLQAQTQGQGKAVKPAMPNMKLELLMELDDFVLDALMEELDKCGDMYNQLETPDQPGYIVLMADSVLPATTTSGADATTPTTTAAVQEGEGEVQGPTYKEYVPLLLQQHADKHYLTFPSFDAAIDEYYCKVK